jgi:hypothetical protein
VKVLRLALSHDLRIDIPEDERQYRIAERTLAEAVGEEWETVLKPIWPADRLPALVHRWVTEERPDLVMVNLGGYWASFGSVALRLERRIPVAGPILARAARKTAETRVAANSRAAEFVRGFGARAIGVEYYFEVDYLLALFERILRQLLQDEHLAIGVRGPTRIAQKASPHIQQECDRRFWAWHNSMQTTCERLHVAFLPFDPEAERLGGGTRLPGDPSHYTLEGTRIQGQREGELMARAWRAAHAPVTG